MASSTTSASSPSSIKYLTQSEATKVDIDLFAPSYGFVTEQLMELAGLSVAMCVQRHYGPGGLAIGRPTEDAKTKGGDDKAKGAPRKRTSLVVCGPGNNGGDGLVCSRHLSHFGWSVDIIYPKSLPPKQKLYQNLMLQAQNVGAKVTDKLPNKIVGAYDIIIDAIFGYSFTGEIRPPFDSVIQSLVGVQSKIPVVAIDIPSGWHVELGPRPSPSPPLTSAASAAATSAPTTTATAPAKAPQEYLAPEMLISLTAPKLCAKHFHGKYHILGGRFVPEYVHDTAGVRRVDRRLLCCAAAVASQRDGCIDGS